MKTIENEEIVSAARITVRSENRTELDLTISTLLDLIRHEQGCRTYRCYGEIGDKNALILIGEWETRDAWSEHLKSDNFGVLIGSLKLLNDQSDVDFKLLAHVTGIEAVTRVRCKPSVETESPIQIT
ncbi:MAG: antibiotic biosynthesis monooxygenase [Pyrinomonadaceae bacterium]|nr:antibiotic biosynthesis monooxygenase [Pyrinomonadaceae bacterium]